MLFPTHTHTYGYIFNREGTPLDLTDAVCFASIAFYWLQHTYYCPNRRSPRTEQILESLPLPFPDPNLVPPFLSIFPESRTLCISVSQIFPRSNFQKRFFLTPFVSLLLQFCCNFCDFFAILPLKTIKICKFSRKNLHI